MSFLTKFIKIKKLYLIGILKNEEGEFLSVLKVRKTKQQLAVIESQSFQDMQALLASLDKKLPAILVVDGKGVLTKKILLKNEADTAWFKNLDYDTIYFTSHKTEEAEFLSFCRKSMALEYVAAVEKAEIQILDFYVGPVISVLMKDLLGSNAFYSNHSLLQFSGDTLAEIEKSDAQATGQQYNIGGMQLSNKEIPLYGAAINYFVKEQSVNKSAIEKITDEEFLYKIAFEKLGIFTLAFFFVMLLSSYCLIQYFIGENAKLNLENSYSYRSYDLIKELEAKRVNKLKILNETGFSSRKFISFYCSELGKSIPLEVSLSVMDVYPLQKEIKKNEKMHFNYRTILLRGKTENKLVFSSWIEKLKNEKWVKSLEIVSITRDKKDVTYFELKIMTNDV